MLATLPGGLTVYTVDVFRLSTEKPRVLRRRIAARDAAHAQALAIGTARTRANLPTSVALIAEVVK